MGLSPAPTASDRAGEDGPGRQRRTDSASRSGDFTRGPGGGDVVHLNISGLVDEIETLQEKVV